VVAGVVVEGKEEVADMVVVVVGEEEEEEGVEGGIDLDAEGEGECVLWVCVHVGC
jgi:hypothetical protein